MNKKLIGSIFALALMSTEAVAAEPVCTGATTTTYVDLSNQRTVERMRARPTFTVPEGTPQCAAIGFNINDTISEEHRALTRVGALNLVCAPSVVEAMRGRFVYEGTCRFEDGTTVRWRAQPRPQD